MVGYFSSNQDVLTGAEQAEYRAFYCGLCREMRQLAGMKSRLVLNYDMTFLILLLTALYDLPTEEVSFVCAAHPSKKQVAYVNEATKYCAKMNLILGYHRLVDEHLDDGIRRKGTLAKSFRRAYESARAEYPEKAAAIEILIQKLRDGKARREENIDIMAGYKGSIFAELFLWKQDEWAKNLADMGYYLGKFIYTLEAYGALEQDTKCQKYNPLLVKKNCNPDCYEVFCRQALSSMVGECVKSFECLPIVTRAELIRNILHFDAWETV